MLVHLSIRGLAIIDRLEVSFRPGLNIISGETGAGKSILLGAVQLLMGAKAQGDLVRDGAPEAAVQGLFELPEDHDFQRFLTDCGIESKDELLIGRVVAANGRSRAYVNDRLINLSVLREIGSRLLSVSGQHESQRLLNESEHLILLDRFGALVDFRDEVAAAHDRLNKAKTELERLAELAKDQGRQAELLAFQVDEIDKAQLVPGEDEELEAESRRLANAQRLSQGASTAHEDIYGADQSVLGVLAQNRQELERLAQLDPVLGTLAGRLEEAGYVLEDVARELEDYASRVVFDPVRQEEVDERIDLVRRLIRKYAAGEGIEAVLAKADEARSELGKLENLDEEIGLLERQVREEEGALEEKAAELSRRRTETASRLVEAVAAELKGLGLQGATFEVSLQRRPGPIGPDGFDEAAFLLSANPGEGLRPLARVASGGELSRITLALKGVLASQGAVESIIFDEIDSGIGGKAAEVVGRKLRSVSDRHQVLCITHLPQIAAFGQTHLRVVKEVGGSRTTSRIELLDEDERVQEVARMLGGANVTDKALAHAREMLASSGYGLSGE